jgi:predicted nucleic acid-binding protein
MSCMIAVDTNIIVYAFDQADPSKQRRALDLLAQSSTANAILLWQVYCEAGSQLSRLAVRQARFDVRAALAGVRARLRLVMPSPEVADTCWDLRQRFQLSYWDGLLLAACIDAGVTRLYTEDTQSAPKIESVELINPFA